MAFTSLPNLLYFPETLMRDNRLTWELQSRVLSSGRSLGGVQTITTVDGGGYWGCSMQGVQVSTADHVRAWRALSARLDGGATPVVLGNRDLRFAPWPDSTLTDPYEAAFSDLATFSDLSDWVSDRILATVYAAAALRATSLTLAIASGSALRGGEYFSIEHNTYSHRLYRVVSVDTSTGNSVVTVRPPLREAVAAGTKVDFDTPKCVMRLATPDSMDLALERRLYGQADVKWVEAFPPWP